MTDEAEGSQNIQADNNSIAFGGISVGGNVGDIRIGHTIGFTSEQVSTLITQISTTFQPKPFDGRSPYKGLDVFEEEDSELFFGREKLVDDLVSRVKDSFTVFITGPSGSGKSSLVRAGLIHALKQGAIQGSERWQYATIKPGREPIQTLARSVAGLVMSTNAEDEIRAKALTDESIFARWCEIALRDGRDKRLVLFIDQFEEIFTQISKEEERVAFLNLLTHAAAVENRRVIILFSMRSDFVPNCATYPKLNAVLNQQFVQIGAMQQDELVSAIAQPALRVGLRIDPDLIAQIINDMHGEPGALPLMQFALKDLFDAQQAKGGLIALTLNDYLERGGIRKALERHADQTFAAFSTEEQNLARSIFTGLIEIGRGTQDTRRTAIFDELVPASAQSASVEAIVAKLADARLITTDEIGGKDTVTISHEKLIDAWPWLKKLVNENRDVIALQNEIAEDAKEWDEHKRDASYLYSGARLATAQEKMTAQKIVLNGLAKDFIKAGIALRDAERRAKESLRKRIIIGLVSGIIGLATLAGFAVYQMFRAREQTEIARSGELSALAVSLREKQFDLSLLLSVQALNTKNTTRTRNVLFENAQTSPQLVGYLHGHQHNVWGIAFHPEGKIVASGSQDGTIILWDVEKRRPLGEPLEGLKDVVSVAFSPDGKMLASGGCSKSDPNCAGEVILWDVERRQQIGELLTGYNDAVRSVGFSPDGRTLAVGSGGSSVILWEVENHKQIGELFTPDGPVYSIAFSRDGRTLAAGSGTSGVSLWDVGNRQQIGESLTGPYGGGLNVAFSPDGKIVASEGEDNSIILWEVKNRQQIGEPLKGHTAGVTSIAFSPDGKILASGSVDNTIIIWDMENHAQIRELLRGHSDGIRIVAFSLDGKLLASGGDDDTIILWDLESRQSIRKVLTGDVEYGNTVALSPDGKLLASGGCGLVDDDQNCIGEIVLWNVEKHQPLGQPLTGSDVPETVAFSPDEKILASGSCGEWDSENLNCIEGKVILWDVKNHQQIGEPLRGHTNIVTNVVFSLDNKLLASVSEDNTIILWNVENAQQIGEPHTMHVDVLYSVAFSLDGKVLASGTVDNTIIVWDGERYRSIDVPLKGRSDRVTITAVIPSGKILAYGRLDGSIILWDLEKSQPVGEPLTGHDYVVLSLDFSPDGKFLASSEQNGTIILWNVESRQPFGELLNADAYTNIAFSSDGKTLAWGSSDGVFVLWDLHPESWVEYNCQRVGRNLIRAEWAQYVPDKPYPSKQQEATCPQWPLEP